MILRRKRDHNNKMIIKRLMEIRIKKPISSSPIIYKYPLSSLNQALNKSHCHLCLFAGRLQSIAPHLRQPLPSPRSCLQPLLPVANIHTIPAEFGGVVLSIIVPSCSQTGEEEEAEEQQRRGKGSRRGVEKEQGERRATAGAVQPSQQTSS